MNREARRTNKRQRYAMRAVIERRVACCCTECMAVEAWPANYVGNGAGAVYANGDGRLLVGISYDCWLANREADDELEEMLAELMNDGQRIGSVWDARSIKR